MASRTETPARQTNYGGVTAVYGGRVRLDRRMRTHPRSVAQRRAGSVEFQVYDASNPTGGPLSVMIEWNTNGQVVGGRRSEDGITQVAFWGTNDFFFVACASFMCRG